MRRIASDETFVRCLTGEILVIELQGSGSSGYLWSVVPLPEDDALKMERRSAGALPGGLGSSAYQVFEFKAIHPGRSSLRFELKRPWQGAPTRTRQIDVYVR